MNKIINGQVAMLFIGIAAGYWFGYFDTWLTSVDTAWIGAAGFTVLTILNLGYHAYKHREGGDA